MLGILHHSRHLLHVERAALALFCKLTGAPGFAPFVWKDQQAVIRSVKIEYLLPLPGPGDILVTLRPTRMRACTMSTAFELRSADGQTLYSRGERETCRVDVATMAPAMWGDAYAEAVRGFMG